jgi:hypothetical protein
MEGAVVGTGERSPAPFEVEASGRKASGFNVSGVKP